MLNKRNRVGVNGLLTLDDFNGAFSGYFGISLIDVLSNQLRYSNEQVMYFYSVRKLVGLNYVQSGMLCGFSNSFVSCRSVHLACRKLCLYSVDYDADFVKSYKAFKVYCKPFRIRLSGAERVMRFRRNKKKRLSAKKKPTKK